MRFWVPNYKRCLHFEQTMCFAHDECGSGYRCVFSSPNSTAEGFCEGSTQDDQIQTQLIVIFS